MRKLLFIMIITFAGIANQVQAQCSFVPTITPDNLILCPETQDTLWTQQYDSYQWYKEDSIIVGATQQFLVVDQYLDAGYSFKVAATLNGCTDTSAPALVDGWVFAGMFVIHEGDQGWIDFNGVSHICTDDTLILHLFEFPYDTNIVWYKNGSPIMGEHTNYLNVTESGSYTASASPSLCPNWVAHLGVSIEVEVHEPIKPTITLQNDKLESSLAKNYQWFFNGDSITGANSRSFTPPVSGMYSVLTTDTNECRSMSDAYNFTMNGIHTDHRQNLWIYPSPANASTFITLPEQLENNSKLKMIDALGRVVMEKEMNRQDKFMELDLSDMSRGLYQVIISSGNITYTGKVIKQ